MRLSKLGNIEYLYPDSSNSVLSICLWNPRTGTEEPRMLNLGHAGWLKFDSERRPVAFRGEMRLPLAGGRDFSLNSCRNGGEAQIHFNGFAKSGCLRWGDAKVMTREGEEVTVPEGERLNFDEEGYYLKG